MLTHWTVGVGNDTKFQNRNNLIAKRSGQIILSKLANVFKLGVSRNACNCMVVAAIKQISFNFPHLQNSLQFQCPRLYAHKLKEN